MLVVTTGSCKNDKLTQANRQLASAELISVRAGNEKGNEGKANREIKTRLKNPMC